MSYPWVDERLEKIPRRINLLNSKFDFDNISYEINIQNIKSHNKLNICYGKLFGSDNSYKKIVVKIYEQSNPQFDIDIFVGLLDEIEVHAEIEQKIGYSYYPSHMLFFFASKKGIGIIFDNLGLQLDKINLYRFDFVAKKQMILQLLQQINFLQTHNIYHGDLKQQNICVNSDGDLTLIDFGIAYLETNYNKFGLSNFYYNTTITSGAPEYKLIYEEQQNKSPFPKELFDKSQHFALGGLIFGILVNDASIYFTKSLELINMLKSTNENLEISNLSIRFSYFNENFCDCIKQFINFKLSDSYDDFKPIILNMFEFDHTKRDPIENIIKQIESIDL